jgi:hypothetical protein
MTALRIAIVATLLASSSAFGQDANLPLLQRAVEVVAGQRNEAANKLAITEAQKQLLSDENAKLKAEIEELKKPAEAEKK